MGCVNCSLTTGRSLRRVEPSTSSPNLRLFRHRLSHLSCEDNRERFSLHFMNFLASFEIKVWEPLVKKKEHFQLLISLFTPKTLKKKGDGLWSGLQGDYCEKTRGRRAHHRYAMCNVYCVLCDVHVQLQCALYTMHYAMCTVLFAFVHCEC